MNWKESQERYRKIETDSTKFCPKCETLKELDEFSTSKADRKGRTTYCKPCAAENSRKNYKKRMSNPEYAKQKKAYERNQRFIRIYGVTAKEYEELLMSQGSKCDICRVELSTEGHGTHLDHCHTSGKNRAILCTNCNRGLGHFKDNPDFLRRAAEYIEHHNADDDCGKEETNNESSH